MKTLIKVCRNYLQFLKDEEPTQGEDRKGQIRAFLFDNIWKCMMILIDETISQVERTAN